MATDTDAPPDEKPRDELHFVRNWLEAIELSEKEERDWTKVADRACDTYRGGTPKDQSYDENLATFNIFHSNVETLVPALYNSTPIPDVRRRFNDNDPVAKDVCELFERSVSYQLDAYDFDATILTGVKDMVIVDRGVVRIRYLPGRYETVTCDYVPWRTFRRGPARVWADVPWVAFRQTLSYSEVVRLIDDEPAADKKAILAGLKFSYSAEPKKELSRQADNKPPSGARADVWEIWDRDNREVHFISPDYTSRRLTTVDDPLGLHDFFPIPRPLSGLASPDSLVPIAPLQVYETLLGELNIVQRRIMRLTNQLRVRGWYAGLNATDIIAAANADDGEMVPLTGAEQFVTTGQGIEKAITYWPIREIAEALARLVEQREVIKQTIYEVTGISDIIRGNSDSRETATAQQIKTQWGSLRIQRMQAEVARFGRDLFRLKVELMANKFRFESFENMAGMKFPTEAEKQQVQQTLAIAQQGGQQPDPKAQELLAKPSREQVEALIRDDATRGFRVDIESDSTVRGDLQKSQEQMSLFLQGTAQYLQAIGAAQGMVPPDIAIEIYSGFARSYRLGKQAEDALDKLADQARQTANQPKPPSPEEQKLQLEREKMQAEMQKMQMEMQKMQMELQLKQAELQLKEREMAADLEMEKQKAVMEAQIQQMKADQDMQIAAAQARQDAEQNRDKHIQDMRARANDVATRQAMERERAVQSAAMQAALHDQKMRHGEVAFKAGQRREDIASQADAGVRAGILQKRAAKDDEERAANKGKPVKFRVTKRDGDRSIAEAEFY